MISKEQLLDGLFAIKEKSEQTLRDSVQLGQLISAVQMKILKSGDKVAAVKTDLKDLLAMVKGQINGSYDSVPWKSLVAITGGLIYFVNPFDLMPDFLAGIGYVDDLKMLEIIVRQVQVDLDAYRSSRDE